MAANKIIIRGFILDQKTKKGISNLRVEAWDKDMLVDDFVGSAATDSQGRFMITFTRKYFSELFLDQKPDLYFKIFQRDELLKSTEETVLWNIEGDKKDVQISIEIVKNLDFTFLLTKWSKENDALVSYFQENKKTNSMHDIALKFNKSTFIDKVKDYSIAETEDDKKSYASMLYDELFHIEPTAMLINMIKDPQVPILNDAIGAYAAKVLETQTDFNIKTTSIYELFKKEDSLKDIPTESQENVEEELKTLQRIVAVSPVPDAIPVLYNAKMSTAFQITEIPQLQFISLMKNNGLDEPTLNQVHNNAQQTRVRNEHALLALREVNNGTGVAMIDNSLYPSSKTSDSDKIIEDSELKRNILNNSLKRHKLSLYLLFGDTDLCDKFISNSIYNAVSNYVKLLDYMRSNDPVNYEVYIDQAFKIISKKKNISGISNEKLGDHRQKLSCLELTFKNTSIEFPYIDLVNEVLENYVAFEHIEQSQTKSI